MNALEILIFIVRGPYAGLVGYHGDLLWTTPLFLPYFDASPLSFITLCTLHLALNMFYLETGEVGTNIELESKYPEIATLIKQKVARDHLPTANILYQENSSGLNAFCYRTFGEFYIIVTKQWFEIKNAAEALDPILEHELAHARAQHVIKRALFSTVAFSIPIGAIWLYVVHIPRSDDYGFISLALITFVLFRLSTLLQAWYHRHQEFEADALALKHTTPEKLANSLLFIRDHNDSEKIAENYKTWMRFSHPSIFNRIKKLKENT